MKKLIQRVLIFIIGLPLVVLIVVVFPYRQYLVLNVVVIIFSALGALELRGLLAKKNLVISTPETVILGILGPMAALLRVSFAVPDLFPLFMMAGLSWVLISRVFSREHAFEKALLQTTTAFSVMIYPGIFLLWIIRMALFPEAGMVILVFLLSVFANDSLAWATGMLLGRGNQGIIPASPKKSVAGFAGGFTGSILVCIGAVLCIPQAFTREDFSFFAGLILGFGTALAASLGDLAESVLKRSAGVKDSGIIMPGRGGVLDSVDSIALAAPVFYGLYLLLFR
ncbi:MAG: phosphatidate cytidylyltransferase [Treponema sp.]|jgi:phosphatidate cytidylyltransferase|nr:phosphatidate cytidylyltransferase [Treponema sp.]